VTVVESTEVFDEEATRILFIGTEEEIAQGLVRIDRNLRVRCCAWIRKLFPGMKPHDLADAWQETLVGVWRSVTDGRFDADQPLMPFLCSIFWARAVDHTRRTKARDDAIAAVGEQLRGTRTGEQWKRYSEAERSEIRELIRDAIATLPEKQRVVWQVFVDNYPETKSMEVLRVEVSKVTGKEETLAAVKRALQEGRPKVREFLERKGYDDIGKRGDE
jgi:RNA polymerase sigma factor (sigma-70 family)